MYLNAHTYLRTYVRMQAATYILVHSTLFEYMFAPRVHGHEEAVALVLRRKDKRACKISLTFISALKCNEHEQTTNNKRACKIVRILISTVK